MTRTRVTALLLATILLVSAIGGVVTVAMANADGSVAAHDSDDGVDMESTAVADEAYVTSNGDVMLVYDYEDDTKDISAGHAGVNVSAGLAHVNVTDTDVETDTTGTLTLWASPDEVAANGTLSAPQPDWLTDAQFELESVQNRTHNQASMDVNATIGLNDRGTSLLAVIQQARTSGFVESTSTSLVSNGSASVETVMAVGADRSHHVVLTESDGSYTLAVEESYVRKSQFGEDPTAGWESRAAAKATLEEQFCADGSPDLDCTVTVDSYALGDGDRPRLDLAYTVSYDGVDATISQAIVQGLTQEPRMNTSEAQATELATHVENVTLSRLEANLVSEQGETSVTWNVSIDGQDDLTLAYAGFLETVERASMGTTPDGTESMMLGGPFSPTPGELADQLRRQVAASRTADLTQTTQWDLSFTTGSETAQLDGTVTSETTNWASYIDELEARDGQVPAATAMSLLVETTDDRVVVDGAATVHDEEMFQRTLERYNQSLNQYGTDTSEVRAVFDAIDRANFTRARMDVEVTEQRVTVEGAAAVENATAVSDTLPEPFASIDGSYTDLEAGQTTVYLNDAVAGDADADAVRQLDLVGEETDVALAGEWDREFDSLDVDYVEHYLGLADDGSGDDLPIVVLAGGGLAVTAAAGGGIVLFRRLG